MKNYEKEGAMADGAVSNIVTLIVGIGVAVLIMIFVGALGGQTYQLVEDDIDAIANNVISADTFTALNNSPVFLDHSFVQSGTLTITNASATGNLVGLTNFTIDYNAGTVLLKSTATHATYNGTTMYANYTWGAADVKSSVKGGVVSSFEALEQTGDYLPIIVLAVVIALVLSLVLSFMAFGGGGAGGNAL